MTVQTDVSRSGPYAGAGTTGPFTVGFRFLDDSHLRVIQTSVAGVNTDLVLTTDYSVTGAGGASGTVTTTVAVPSGETITILRNVPFTQEADYVDNDSFPAESHEAALDKLTMQTQQVREAQERAVALSPTATGGSVSTELPPPVANNIIGWNSSANAIANFDPTGLAGIISYGTFKAETFDGDGVETDFVLTEDALVAANCSVSVGGAVQVPDVNFEYVPSTKTVRFLTGAPPVGTDNVLVRYGSVLDVGTAAAVDGQTAIGTALIHAVDAAAARTAIGAVGLTGNESLAGVKTFASSPVVPDLVIGDTSSKAANAKLVADSISGNFSSSAENVAGTAEGKSVDPLGIREAFNATGGAPVFACRAWVNFIGTGTVSIRASGNVSSITDNGTGDYTVNFTTAMPDALYATNVSAATTGLSSGYSTGLFSYTVAAVRVLTVVTGGSNSAADAATVNVTVTR